MIEETIFTPETFDKYLEEYVHKVFSNRNTLIPNISILLRDTDKKEFQYERSSSSTNYVDGGDIVFFVDNNGPNLKSHAIYMCMGTLFEVNDLVESFARKYVYDAVFDYPNAHKLDSAYSIIKPQPFDVENTPSRRTNFFRNEVEFSKPEITNFLRNDYEGAKQYLSIIDSEEFGVYVQQLKQNLPRSLEDAKVITKTIFL